MNDDEYTEDEVEGEYELALQLVTETIIIQRGISSDGQSVYLVHWGADTDDHESFPDDLIVVLGMLEAAKLDYLERADLLRNCNTDEE